MSQDYEIKYDQFLSELEKLLPKIDANFANRMMYLERKLENELVKEPQAVLTIEYKTDADLEKKSDNLRYKHSLEIELTDEPNKVLAQGRMRLNKIKDIATDPDIVKIEGTASPTIRS